MESSKGTHTHTHIQARIHKIYRSMMSSVNAKNGGKTDRERKGNNKKKTHRNRISNRKQNFMRGKWKLTTARAPAIFATQQ